MNAVLDCGVRVSRLSVAVLVACAGSAMGQSFRSMDGSTNNLAHPTWGQAGADLIRITPAAYPDGHSAMARPNGPNPRDVSNAVIIQTGSIPNARGMSDLVWQWGQFLDHDLDLTVDGTTEPLNITTSAFDPYFMGSPIGFFRSAFDPATGTTNPRENPNILTSYLDGSNVYGSDLSRCDGLRSHINGRLLVAHTPVGDLLPFNTMGLPNIIPPGGNPADFFAAGDMRCNEQSGLTAMHTLWVREHNYWADRMAAQHPRWSDDDLFYNARMVVIAEIQKITYQDWIPALFGPGHLPAYAGYNPNVNATIATEFSSAAYRIGHTLLSPFEQRLDNNGNPIPQGPLALRDAFFAPNNIVNAGGIAPLLKGLSMQRAQEIDNHVVEDVRSFLFGHPGAGGFDLPSLNIQRARDHGIPDYNTLRVAAGLPPVQSFSDITSDPDTQAALAGVYGDVNSIDPWVGMISEDHLPGGSVGPTQTAIILGQFGRIRDGDRFFYLNDPLLVPYLGEISTTTLGTVIARNTGMTSLQENVFFVPANTCYANCDQSTTPPVLNVNDFICFQAKFAMGDSYANCDNSTRAPVLNVNDFMCFINKYAGGCP